jgi:SAM-dependent methyltransferase
MPEQQIEPQPPPAQELSESATELKPDAPTTDGTAVDANYQYWREHGGDWVEGYDQRKKKLVLYHIQELMLTQYMLEHAQSSPERPMKVLEFGCGVGRHLRNLTRLPGVDAFGYDQSQTMAQGVLRWAGKAWFDSHITVGMPTGTLPYPDKHFDIAYSAEVLVHVRPEHVDGILKELIRVCKGHILHIETSEHVQLVSDSHDGCWRHDLVAAYARLGLECQVLPSGYTAHTPYRVAVGEQPRFTWAPAILEMYRRLERDINEGFSADAMASHQLNAELHHRVALLTSESAQRAHEIQSARAAIAGLTESVEAEAKRADTLAGELEQSRAAAARSHELEQVIAAVNAQNAALTARAAELEQLWEQERQRTQTLTEQRKSFVVQASGLLRR